MDAISKQLLPLGKNNDTSKTPPCVQENHLPIFSSNGRISEKELSKRNSKIDYALSRIGITPDADIGEGSTASQLTPYSTLRELVAEYENSENKAENTAAILEPFYQTTDKFSRAMEIFRDFWAAVGKFLACLLLPGIYSATHDACCKMRDTALTKTIRRPLFEATKTLIEQKLKNGQNLDDLTKLKYIHLLSSIDGEGTIELLQEAKSPVAKQANKGTEESDKNIFTSLLPTSKTVSSETTESTGDVSPIEIKYTYEDLRKDLDHDLHVILNKDENPKFKLIENPANADLIKSIYRNLVLREEIPGTINRGREAKPISESQFAVHRQRSELARIVNLAEEPFSRRTRDVCASEEDDNYDFLVNTPSQASDNSIIGEVDGFDRSTKKSELSGNTWECYRSKDDKLHAAIIQDNETKSLEMMQNLGLITPNTVRNLRSRGGEFSEVRPVYITFRPTQTFRDAFSAMRNIMDGVPDMIRHADELTQAALRRIEKQNERNRNSPGYVPLVPVFLGFSMGGMAAETMATKYGYASVTFNALGLGEGLQNYAKNGPNGEVDINDDFNAIFHQSFFMEGDWVRDMDNNFVSKYIVGKKVIGQPHRIDLSDEMRTQSNIIRHNSIDEVIDKWAHTPSIEELLKIEELLNTMGIYSPNTVEEIIYNLKNLTKNESLGIPLLNVLLKATDESS